MTPIGTTDLALVCMQPVTVRWLEAPSCWRWPRHLALQDAAEPQGIESPFGPHTPPQEELPWIRMGTLACAAVMHDGTFQVSPCPVMSPAIK